MKTSLLLPYWFVLAASASNNELESTEPILDVFQVVHDRELQQGLGGLTCTLIENRFEGAVTCDCDDKVVDGDGSFSFGCAYDEAVCTEGICVRPSYESEFTSGMGQVALNTEICARDMKLGLANFDDLCLTTELCVDLETIGDGTNGLCSCSVTFGGEECQTCEPCGLGQGVFLDCTNINPEIISAECTDVDLNFGRRTGGEGGIRPWLPAFNGSCTFLETISNNTVNCDCSRWEGVDLGVTCYTRDLCNDGVCTNITATAAVDDFKLDWLSACSFVDYDDTGLKPVCTNFTMCENQRFKLCDVDVTLNGKECIAETCGDGEGITIDCSVVDESIMPIPCADVDAQAAFSFLPAIETKSGSNSTSASRPAVWSHTQVVLVTMVAGLMYLGL